LSYSEIVSRLAFQQEVIGAEPVATRGTNGSPNPSFRFYIHRRTFQTEQNNYIFKYKNRRGKSKTIVGEIPTIDFMLFLIFCPVKWAFEMRKGVKAFKGVKVNTS
jgi:hypothetical protein